MQAIGIMFKSFACELNLILLVFIHFYYRSPSERPGKDCCGQWFAGPPLRAVIAVVALGKTDANAFNVQTYVY